MGRYADIRNEEVQEQLSEIRNRAATLAAVADREGIPADARTVLSREVFRLQVLENALQARHRAIGSTFSKADKALLEQVAFDTETLYWSRFPRLPDLLEQARYAALNGQVPREDVAVALALSAAETLEKTRSA